MVTPEQAEDVYYRALLAAYHEHHNDWTRPTVQRECILRAWQAVVDALTLQPRAGP